MKTKLKYRSLALITLLFIIGNQLFSKTINYTVILRSNYGTMTLWDGNVIDIYGLAPTLSAVPTVPAKILYADEGDTVIINARSISQNDHHTIHLHGLDVDTRNDGDPATSFQLSHQQDTTYTFIAKHAGTYLYHCHVADVVHVQMGMYGLIIVKAAGGTNNAWTGGPAYDKEYAWLMSEIDKAWHDSVPVHNDTTGIVTLPVFKPNYFLVNGKSQQQISGILVAGSVGEKIYLRLGNIGFYNNRIIFPASLGAVLIDSDGRPFDNALQTDTVEIMPGERYGVMLTPSAEFTGVISIEYSSMNKVDFSHTEQIGVSINGFIGINEKNVESNISIYPNPATNEIRVTGLKNISHNFEITTILGEVVIHIEAQGNKIINVNELSPGNYFIVMKHNDGISFCKMFSIIR